MQHRFDVDTFVDVYDEEEVRNDRTVRREARLNQAINKVICQFWEKEQKRDPALQAEDGSADAIMDLTTITALAYNLGWCSAEASLTGVSQSDRMQCARNGSRTAQQHVLEIHRMDDHDCVDARRLEAELDDN